MWGSVPMSICVQEITNHTERVSMNQVVVLEQQNLLPFGSIPAWNLLQEENNNRTLLTVSKSLRITIMDKVNKLLKCE